MKIIKLLDRLDRFFGRGSDALWAPGLYLWWSLVRTSLLLILVLLALGGLAWFATTPIMDAIYSTIFDWLGIWKRG